MLKLGFSKVDVMTMPYSRAAWYVQATAEAQDDGPSVRDATQADIDSF